MALECKHFILLILLQLSLRRGTAQSESNLALGKPAWQSTTYIASNSNERLEANRANDGVKDIFNITDRRYSHTNTTKNSWWCVNLQSLFYITKIVIYNRGGTQNWRLNNVSVLTLTAHAKTNPSLKSSLWIQRFYQREAFGNIGIIELSPAAPAIYLAVFSNGADGVVLREVEVYGFTVDYNNLALGKNASQSSDWNAALYPASMAVNGIKDDFTHTAQHDVKWWKVDLGQLSLVESVTVYNRPNFYYRLRMFSILTSITGTDSFLSPDWITCRRVEQQVNASIFAPCNRVLARFVAIYSDYRAPNKSDNVLSLAEVEVNGTAMLGVEELKLSSVNKTCTNITWERSSQFLEELDYQFRCGNTEWRNTKELSGVSCLKKPTDQVTCSVRAGFQSQYGPETAGTVNTSCSAPDLSVLNTSYGSEVIGGRNRQTVKVIWQVLSSNCDSILETRLHLTPLGAQTGLTIQRSVTGGNETFHNLEPDTDYNLTITTKNNHSLSSSRVTRIKTPESPPDDPPSDYQMISVNGSCIKLSWKAPVKMNGVLRHYQYKCEVGSLQTGVGGLSTTSDTSVLVCQFPSATKVSCRTNAVNGVGESPWANASVYTQFQVKSFPDVKISTYAGEQPKLILEKVELQNSTKPIIAYRIIVYEEDFVPLRSRREMADLILREIDYPSSRAQKIKYYVAAEISSQRFNTTFTFVLGDGRNYGPFLNAPLTTGKTYSVTYGVGVELEVGAVIFKYNPKRSAPFMGTKRTDDSESTGSNIGLIVGVLLAAMLCVVLLVMGLLYHRRRKAKKNKGLETIAPSGDKQASQSHGNNKCNSFTQNRAENNQKHPERREPARGHKKVTEADCVAMLQQTPTKGDPAVLDQRSSEVHSDSALYDDCIVTRIQDEIAIHALETFVESHKDLITDQYKRLAELPLGEMTVAALPENKGKSRYKRLYPVDSYRVILKRELSQGTDYINASHIQGYKGEGHYIAAQGPTEATVLDFWHMIWQEMPAAIVALTNVWESGTKKCEQYWPEQMNQELLFGDVTVSLHSEEMWADYSMRILKVTRGDQTVFVRQFHYQSWPDHGVPQETAPFVLFHQKVKSHVKNLSGALLVHCSAGVGRSGSYIALDYLLSQANSEGRVSVFDCVKEMRQRRPAMVQTEDQYLFVYSVLLDAIIAQDFICTPSQVSTRLASFAATSARDIISEEFSHIQKLVGRAPWEIDTDKEAPNQQKNLYQNAPPAERFRIYLRGATGSYINAIKLNGYREKAHLVVTQHPLRSAVSDFWQLVSEVGSQTIVQLGKSKVTFLPFNADIGMKFGDNAIILNGSDTSHCYETLHLNLTTQENEKTLKVFRVDSFVENATPSTKVLLAVLAGVEKWQQQSGNRPIIITCRDGATLSGLFVAAYNSLERLKAEQDIDVYNPVLMARLRRPQFVSSVEQYVLLYKMLREYANDFSEYANFN